MTAQVGDCIMTRHDDGAISIDRADPRIGIDAEMLAEIAEGRYPFATLTPAAQLPGWWPAAWNRVRGWEGRCPLGAVLRIEGVNRTVIYRIFKWDILPDRFLAEWPD